MMLFNLDVIGIVFICFILFYFIPFHFIGLYHDVIGNYALRSCNVKASYVWQIMGQLIPTTVGSTDETTSTTKTTTVATASETTQWSNKWVKNLSEVLLTEAQVPCWPMDPISL